MSRLALAFALVALVVLAPASARHAAPDGRSIRLGGTALELVGTRDSLWVLTCDRRCTGEARASVGRIVRIDARDGSVVTSVSLSRPHALAVGGNSVYALDFWRDTVRRLDTVTLRTTAMLRLVLPFEVAPGDDAFLPFDVAVGQNAVWVSTARGALSRVDLQTSRVLAMVRLPGDATGRIAVGEGAVCSPKVCSVSTESIQQRTEWRHVSGSGHVRTGSQSISRSLVRKVLAVGSWTRNDILTGKRGLARIDPRRNRLEVVTALPSGPLSVAFGKGSVWVARVGESLVERIDLRTGKVTDRFHADDVNALAVAGGHVWTATRHGTIRRIATP